MAPPRRRAPHQPSPPPQDILSESEEEYISAGASEDEQEQEPLPEHEHELLSDEEQAEHLSEPSEPPLSPSPHSAHVPANLREISTLASWTVSSSKPGCSIPQLRHPSPSLFWQSDGPQPHFLNIHFFKLVRIVGLRLYLDFEQDESYTPTRIVLLAGSGMNDLVEWGEMRLESPRGWVWADFSGVGDPENSDDSSSEEDDEDDDGGIGAGTRTRTGRGMQDAGFPHGVGDDIPIAADDSSDHENTAPRPPPPASPMQLDPSAFTTPQQQGQNPHVTPVNLHAQTTPSLPRPHPRAPFASLSPESAPQPRAPASPKRPKMPVLRCHLVQIKILENHQNGKDTHLRGLQIFARDNEGEERGQTVRSVVESKGLGGGVTRKREVGARMKSMWDDEPVLR